MSVSAPYSSDPYPAEPYPSPGTAAVPETTTSAAVKQTAWWLALGAAVLGLAIGVMMMLWPEATLKVVAALFGAWLLAHGVVRLVQGIVGDGRDGAERALLGVIGIIFVMAGVLALRNLLVSLALVVTLIGLMWLVGGVMELISAFGGPGGGHRWWHAFLGALSIVAGVVVLLWPHLSLVTLVYVTGVWMVVMGVAQIAMVIWARRSLTA